MRQLSQSETAHVGGAGYWATDCDIFGCYSTYVYEDVFVSGYWETYDVVECGFFGCATYTVDEWVPGYWALV